MPKSISYRAHAIIYFEGDKTEGIFVLKKGRVELTHKNIVHGTENRDSIKAGEFFGVKAVLGSYPHDETATAVTDSMVISFSLSEFEKMLVGNSRILMKMLQVFSTQLRHIHSQVQGILMEDDENVEPDPEAGLFSIGEYYMNARRYENAYSVFKRYLTHWPKGTYAPQASLKMGEVESILALGATEESRQDAVTLVAFSEVNKQYHLGNYQYVVKTLMDMIKKGLGSIYLVQAEFLLGSSLYWYGRYESAVKHLASFVHKYPRHPKLGEVYWYTGLSHESLNNYASALRFYEDAYEKMEEGDKHYVEVQKKIIEMREST